MPVFAASATVCAAVLAVDGIRYGWIAPIGSLVDVGSARWGLIGEDVDGCFDLAILLGDGEDLAGDGRRGEGLVCGCLVFAVWIPFVR
jgi:hypothetical protein